MIVRSEFRPIKGRQEHIRESFHIRMGCIKQGLRIPLRREIRYNLAIKIYTGGQCFDKIGDHEGGGWTNQGRVRRM